MENPKNISRLELTKVLPQQLSEYPPLLQFLSELPQGERLSTERLLCRIDLYFLLRYALGRDDLEDPWIFDRCREVQAEPNGFIDLWAREHYKSTIITFGQTIQDILSSHGQNPLEEWKGREATIGIFSFNRPTAKAFLRQIKYEFETNSALKQLFPDILFEDPKKQSPKWSEDEGIIVKRKSNPKESTIEASGLVDGQPTSKHYLIRMYDDVVTLESARTREMIKKTTEAWEISLNLGADGGYERYAGTFYADGDTYHEIIDRDIVTKRLYPGSDDGTISGKPVLWSQETFDYKLKGMGIYTFSTQILLDPVPDENSYFSKDDFEWYDEVPEYLRKYGASDYAVTEGGGDFTEHGVCGVDPEDDLYIIDWWYGQTTPDVWIETQLDLVDKHKPVLWGGEGGPIRRSIEPFLEKRMRDRRSYVTLQWFPAVADKPTNCRSFQARAKQGKVYLPRNKAWAQRLLDQLLRVPRGRFDDAFDVCGLFGRMLDDMGRGSVPHAPKLKLVGDDYGVNDDDEKSDWMTA